MKNEEICVSPNYSMHLYLVFFTGLVRMDGFACETVVLVAEGACERVDIILEETPPAAVGGATVKTILRTALRDAQTFRQVLLVLLRVEEFLDLLHRDDGGTCKAVVEWAIHLRVVCVGDRANETVATESVETVAK